MVSRADGGFVVARDRSLADCNHGHAARDGDQSQDVAARCVTVHDRDCAESGWVQAYRDAQMAILSVR
jgi:hypothetical protein